MNETREVATLPSGVAIRGQGVATPSPSETAPVAGGHPMESGPLFTAAVILAAVGVVAMAASASTLAALGTAAGWTAWGGRMGWALPASIDLLALGAAVVLFARQAPAQVRQAAVKATGAAVVLSVVLNSLAHLVESGDLPMTVWTRLGVSAVPPLAAALAVHMVGMILGAVRPVPVARAVATPVMEVATPGQHVAAPAPKAPPEAATPAAPEAAPAGWEVTDEEPWPPRVSAAATGRPVVSAEVADEEEPVAKTSPKEALKLPDEDPEAVVAWCHANGINQSEAARQSGLPRTTVRRRYEALNA